MARLAQTAGLTDVQQEILATVKTFVDKEIIPHATALEHADEYPQDIVDGMKEMGLFGLTIPEEYGGLDESLLTYALVVEQIARGWMSVSGVINTHFMVAYMLTQYGTSEQKARYLPQMAAGEVRGSYSMSEPDLGSDVAAIKTRAVQDGGSFVVDGAKMWLTNGGTSNLTAVLVRTDEGAPKPYQNLTCFLVDKPVGYGEVAPGLTVPGKLDKMGYKGVDTTELVFSGFRISGDQILGGLRGNGFKQMLDAIEVGRVNVAARACGISIRAFELAAEYAQQRRTFGKPIAQHQAIAFKLADMATEIDAARLLTLRAAWLKDREHPYGKEAAMAKLYASDVANRAAREAIQIFGGNGYVTEFPVERHFRDAKITEIYEGTSEIQRLVIANYLTKGG